MRKLSKILAIFRMSQRHLARAIALQALFMWDFNDEDSHNLHFYTDYAIREFAIPGAVDGIFVWRLVQQIAAHKQKLDSHINNYAKEWPVERLTIIDRTILRIALFEMLYEKDIPAKVAINEAVELAKDFSGSSSQKFVSGVLGAIYETSFKNHQSTQ